MGSTKRGSWTALGVAVAIFFLASFWLYSSFRLGDDTYIYLQFVRNMLSGGGMSFSHGVPTYGFTSVVWLFLLTITQCVLKDFLLTPVVLDVAMSVLCIVAVWVAARRVVPDDLTFASTVALVMCIEPNLLKHAYLGMETPLSGLMVFGVVFLYVTERKGEGRFPWSGLLAGMSVLNRPESALVLALVVLDQRIHHHPLKRIIIWLLIAALPVVLWMFVAMAQFGTFVPNTYLAKGGAYPIFSKFWTNLIDSAVILTPVYGVVFVSMAAQGASACLGRRWSWIRDNWLYYAIPIVTILFLCSSMSNELVYARYYFLFGPTIVFAAVLFLQPSYSFLGERARIWLRRLIVFQFILISLWMGPATTAIFRSQEEAKGRLDRWILENTPRQASILTGTIGQIAFETQRNIICWMGITNPELIPFLRANNGAEYFGRIRPDYMIISGTSASDMKGFQIGKKDSIVYRVPVSKRILVRQILFGAAATDTLYLNVVKVTW